VATEHNIVINIVVRTQDFTKKMGNVTGGLTNLNATLGRVTRTMTAFAALFIARKFITGIIDSVKAFSEFEKSVANVGILLDDEVGRMGEWGDAISTVSAALGLSVTDLAKGAFDIQSATNDMNLSLEIFVAASRLAVAGGSDLASTVSGMLTLNEAYGKSFKNVADQADFLIVAQKKARATIGELSTSSSKFLSVASSLGIKVEELFAVYSQLTRGFGNTREAATALSAIMNALQKPSQRMIDFARENFGMSIQQAIATEGLITVMERLKTVAVEDLGTTLGRIRANRAYAIVSSKTNVIQESAIELTDRQGKVNEKTAIQTQTLAVQMKQLGGELGVIRRKIGEDIADTGMVAALRDILTIMNEMQEQQASQDQGFFTMMGNAILATNPNLEAFLILLRGVQSTITETAETIRETNLEDILPELDPDTQAKLSKWVEDAKNFKTVTEGVLKEIENIGTKTFDSLVGGFGKFAVAVIVEGEKAGDAFKDMMKSVASTVINLIAQMIIKLLAYLALMVVAKFLDPFTAGTASLGVAAFRPTILGFAGGGIVPGVGKGDRVPALLEPGELVIPKNQVAGASNSFNSSPTINVSMAGAMVMDSPIHVQRLYREYLRDVIRDDITNGRDTFYG